MRIFYSWQNDLNRKSNRGFILECLEEAIKKLNADIEIEPALRELEGIELDHDTKGVVGTPDITATIFDKIRNSDIYIADVSIVGSGTHQKNRKIPNPNVLIELGFALGVLGSDKVILVMDTAHGGNDDLPFNLKHKRLSVSFDSSSIDHKKERSELVGSFKVVIRPFLGTRPREIMSLPSTPSYLETIETVLNSDSKDDWLYTSISWKNFKIYKKNLNLRFEMDYDEENGVGIHKQRFREAWATGFADEDATSYWCDLHFGHTTIKRFILVAVDGGRALLPCPTRPGELSVRRVDYKVAQIHDSTGELDHYMSLAGLYIEESGMTSIE